MSFFKLEFFFKNVKKQAELVVLTRDKFGGPIFVSRDGEDASNLDFRFVLAVESVPPLEVPD